MIEDFPPEFSSENPLTIKESEKYLLSIKNSFVKELEKNRLSSKEVPQVLLQDQAELKRIAESIQSGQGIPKEVTTKRLVEIFRDTVFNSDWNSRRFVGELMLEKGLKREMIDRMYDRAIEAIGSNELVTAEELMKELGD